ncbi:MAG TPA: LCP family protein [Candidatus Xenobia bacterium]|jgi:LCP family protein required for cell wall assembly
MSQVPVPGEIAPPPRKLRWMGWLLVIASLLGGAGIIAAGVALNAVRQGMAPGTTMVQAATEVKQAVQAVTVEDPAPIVFGDRNTMNIMVLGIDYDYTDSDLPFSKTARSDTIFVLQVRRDGKYLGMLSMPRDMYVQFPDGGHDKVNSAYSRGGVSLEKQMLSEFLGLDFDHYFVVRIDGATKIIDRIGGLDIPVEKDMNYDDNWGHLHVHLKKGLQHLDGAQSVGYARFRHDEEGDRGRMRRQKVVINALLEKLHEASTYSNPVSLLTDLAQITRQSLQTDLRPDQLVALGKIYQHFDKNDMRSAQLDGRDGTADGASVIFPPEPEQVSRLTQKVIRQDGEGEPPLDVEVFNGSHNGHAAEALKAQLQAAGCNVVMVSEGFKLTPHTMAVVYNADAAQRKMLQGVTGPLTFTSPDKVGGNWLSNPNSADVSIVVGDDYKPKVADSSHPPALASASPCVTP